MWFLNLRKEIEILIDFSEQQDWLLLQTVLKNLFVPDNNDKTTALRSVANVMLIVI